MEQSKRNGKFTSSQLYRICGSIKSGAPTAAFNTYVEEVYSERLLGRSSEVEIKAQPMKWGSLMEIVLFNLLGLGYKMTHKQTIVHPVMNFFSGTPDLIAETIKIGEIKSYYPKNFALLSMCLLGKNISDLKKKFPKEYWQCVGNAILCDVEVAELICYMPYKSELQSIIEKVIEEDFLYENGLDPQDYYFLSRNDIESLPYLPDDSKMSNVNSFEFKIPDKDIEHVIKRLKMAEDEVLKL